MADLNADLAPQVIEACKANAEEMAGALGRAFEGDFVVKPGESTEFDPATIEGAGLEGAGLAVLMPFGEQAVLAILPQSTGLLPDWASAPDPTGQSKLSTLGQELSMLVVPDDLMADDFQVEWSEDLVAAIGRAEPGEGAVTVPLEIAKGETLGVMHLVWPLANLKAFATPKEEETGDRAEEPTAETIERKAPATEAPTSTVLRWENSPSDYDDLPPNVLNLLRVTTPVSVNLATKSVPISEIIELGPGSIISFDKSCDDLLEISVGDRLIAEGEAVKVGERFGVRIQQMIMPEESFRPMLPPTAS